LGVIAERRTLTPDTCAERILHTACQALDLVRVQAARFPERMDTCPPEGFVRIDVPHPCDRALVEERRLDRGTPSRETFGEASRTESALERFAAERGHSILELAFGWLLAHAPVASVIAGATTPEQVRANAAAAGWVLTADEMELVATGLPIL